MQKLERDGQVLYMEAVLSPYFVAQGWVVVVEELEEPVQDVLPINLVPVTKKGKAKNG